MRAGEHLGDVLVVLSIFSVFAGCVDHGSFVTSTPLIAPITPPSTPSVPPTVPTPGALGTITGTITVQGMAAVGARIRVEPDLGVVQEGGGFANVLSGADGTFRVDIVRGVYRIVATHGDGFGARANVVVAGSPVVVDLALERVDSKVDVGVLDVAPETDLAPGGGGIGVIVQNEGPGVGNVSVDLLVYRGVVPESPYTAFLAASQAVSLAPGETKTVGFSGPGPAGDYRAVAIVRLVDGYDPNAANDFVTRVFSLRDPLKFTRGPSFEPRNPRVGDVVDIGGQIAGRIRIAEAQVYRDGTLLGSQALFVTNTSTLGDLRYSLQVTEPGAYTVTILAEGYHDDQLRESTEFKVSTTTAWYGRKLALPVGVGLGVLLVGTAAAMMLRSRSRPTMGAPTQPPELPPVPASPREAAAQPSTTDNPPSPAPVSAGAPAIAVERARERLRAAAEHIDAIRERAARVGDAKWEAWAQETAAYLVGLARDLKDSGSEQAAAEAQAGAEEVLAVSMEDGT